MHLSKWVCGLCPTSSSVAGLRWTVPPRPIIIDVPVRFIVKSIYQFRRRQYEVRPSQVLHGRLRKLRQLTKSHVLFELMVLEDLCCDISDEHADGPN